MDNTKTLVTKMLLENTGVNMLDSGGKEGRRWQQVRAKLKIKNEPTELDIKQAVVLFEKEPLATFECTSFISKDEAKENKEWEIFPSVNIFHAINNALELDNVCNKFNKLKCSEWDSEAAYGISKEQEKWLLDHKLILNKTWNTYNGESILDTILQGCNINIAGNESNFEYPEYILLQIHGGCDARGGYTDAKLFKFNDDVSIEPLLYANFKDKDFSTGHDGNYMKDDDGNSPKGVLSEILKSFSETSNI